MTGWWRATLWLWAVTACMATTWAGVLLGRPLALALSMLTGLFALVGLHRAVWRLRWPAEPESDFDDVADTEPEPEFDVEASP